MKLPLTVTGVGLRIVRVPLRFTLGTSADTVRAVPLLLLDLRTAEGPIGQAYVFCYTVSGAKAMGAHVEEAVEVIAGSAAAPSAVAQRLARRFALLGVTGTVRMALSAIDMALWDAAAKACGQPLATLLGGAPRPLPAYDSRGLGLMPADALADEAERLAEAGLRAVKLRLGYPTLFEDLAALDAVQQRLGDRVGIMVDYNQALTVAEAMARGHALDGRGLLWIEEPIAHDNHRGNAQLARTWQTPLQAGENLNGPAAVAELVRTEAADLLMPDVARIGGVTGWMAAAGIAQGAGLPVSSHLMPETSLHLLCATPGAHWLEYVDWADAILAEPLRLVDGAVPASERPGAGLGWDEAKLARLGAG